MTSDFAFESGVRSYSRGFPVVLDTAKGAEIFDVDGNRYLDFLSGCGSLNYGHNPEALKSRLLDYIAADGVAMSMDMRSDARERFLTAFHEIILAPRGMDHLVQFTGPTGANAIEAAIKLARKITGRSNVIAFTNGFHGCSLGALSLTGSAHHRGGSAPLLNQVTRMPYDGYFGAAVDTAAQLETLLNDPSGGIDAPAAIILETVQGEGGLQSASADWLREIQTIARAHGALLIVDDIQAGCGRTGTFFSFEAAGIMPDIICMAKAVSGYGLPMSLVLMRPELDAWAPGEHNGTFRGHNLAFVTAAAALETYWADSRFAGRLSTLCDGLARQLAPLADRFGLRVKGRGALTGLAFNDPEAAARVRRACLSGGLLIELCGPRDEVLKFLPPLTLTGAELEEAMEIVTASLAQSLPGPVRIPPIRRTA